MDIWSIGCVFAELLSMQKESLADYSLREPLFPGSSCPSLTIQYESNFVREDQLSTILSIIGSPSESEVSLLSNDKAIADLKKRPFKMPRVKDIHLTHNLNR